MHVSFVSLRIFFQLLQQPEERGRRGRSHSNTKTNLFVSKEKLSAPLPDEGINKIRRHLDTEWERVCGGGLQMRDSDCAGRHFMLEAHKSRIEHVFYAALIGSCGLNWPIFLFQSKRSERNEYNNPIPLSSAH